MEYRRLGISGMKVSVIALGAWRTYGESVEDDTAEKCIEKAIDLGINFIDMADAYAGGKAETVIGNILQNYDRQKFVLSTKAYWPMSEDINDRGLSRKHLFESVENSLKRLQTDYIDIFFCHRYDSDTTTEETVRAISDLIQQGKILYWGTSMWGSNEIHEAVAMADYYRGYRPIVEQPLYNMFDRHVVEGKLEETVSEYGMGLTVFSPLAQGVLTGKYNKTTPRGSRAKKVDNFDDNLMEERRDKARELTELAESIDVTPAALALAWAMAHRNVDSVITGASKPKQLEENVKALEIEIDYELNQKIEDILRNKPYGSRREMVHPDEIPVL